MPVRQRRRALDHAPGIASDVDLPDFLIRCANHAAFRLLPEWAHHFGLAKDAPRRELSHTIRAFADCNFNVKQTAQRLGLHPNTRAHSAENLACTFSKSSLISLTTLPDWSRSSANQAQTPAFISYGDNNRTQMLRVCGPGHVEDRTVSSGCNPYLVFAAYLMAGLDGIDKQIEPGEPNLGNLYALTRQEIYKRGLVTLPQSLKEALTALESDNVVLNALGPIQNEFLKLKWQEWNEYHRQVSGWEIDQYLTFF